MLHRRTEGAGSHPRVVTFAKFSVWELETSTVVRERASVMVGGCSLATSSDASPIVPLCTLATALVTHYMTAFTVSLRVSQAFQQKSVLAYSIQRSTICGYTLENAFRIADQVAAAYANYCCICKLN